MAGYLARVGRGAGVKSFVLLSLILALAIGLRAWSIGWGMPYTLHADEPKYLPKAVTMLMSGDLNPRYFENPPLLTYLFLAELAAYLQLGQWLGFLKGADDIGLQRLVDPTPLYLIARLTSVLLGTGTVLITYLVARRLLNQAVGLMAALFLSVAFLHVRDSHYAVNDVPSTFLLMGAAYFAARIYTDGRRRDYLLGGICLGLGVAAKYNVGLGAVLLFTAHMLRHGGARKGLMARHIPLLGAAFAALLAFLAGNPYAVLDSASFLKGFASQYGWTADPFNTSDVSTIQVLFRALWVGIGPVILAASLLGVIIMAFQRRRETVLLAAFPAVYIWFFLFKSSLFYARFAIPLLPFIAIFAAYGIIGTLRLIPWTWRSRLLLAQSVGIVLIVGAILPSLVLDVRHNSLLRLPDTRLLLGRWVNENIPPGSKIALEGYTFLDSEGRHIGSKGIEYSIEILPSLRVNPLEYYRQEKFDYLISSSFVYGRYAANPDAHSEAIDTYEQLEQQFRRVATISPREDGLELPFLMDEEITPIFTVLERDRPGPTIKVYRVDESREPRYRVDWLTAEGPSKVTVRQKVSYTVVLRNAGLYRWPHEGFTAVRVGYRWLDESGRQVTGPDVHSSLARDLAPDDTAVVSVDVVAPETPGTYTLRLDMVQENFAWFSAMGAVTEEIPVEVSR